MMIDGRAASPPALFQVGSQGMPQLRLLRAFLRGFAVASSPAASAYLPGGIVPVCRLQVIFPPFCAP